MNTQERMTEAVGDYIREIHKEGHTAAEQCLCFKDGHVWTLTLYRIPDDAVALIVKHATQKEELSSPL